MSASAATLRASRQSTRKAQLGLANVIYLIRERSKLTSLPHRALSFLCAHDLATHSWVCPVHASHFRIHFPEDKLNDRLILGASPTPSNSLSDLWLGTNEAERKHAQITRLDQTSGRLVLTALEGPVRVIGYHWDVLLERGQQCVLERDCSIKIHKAGQFRGLVYSFEFVRKPQA